MGLSTQMAAFFDELRKIQDIRSGKPLLPPYDRLTAGYTNCSNYGVKAANAAGAPAPPKVNGLVTSQLGNRGALQQAVKRTQDAQSVGKVQNTSIDLGKGVPKPPAVKMAPSGTGSATTAPKLGS